uniref:Ig-like domain-containing protein n=1 Tax=Lepisosteus oculatus TaxID=7918 RepID=W5N018_LEPOC
VSVTPSDGTETFTKREGKTARINCKISNVGSCQNYIHWYQKKGEASKRILYVSLSGGDGVSDTNHGGADFQARQNGNERYLQIPKVKDSHSAMYYCACWVSHSFPVKKNQSQTISTLNKKSDHIKDDIYIGSENDSKSEQDKATLTKGSGKTARIACKYKGSGFDSAIIHWYQKKENEAMRRILYIQSVGGTPTYDNVNDKEVFKASKNSNSESELMIVGAQSSHSATYYCACWDT